MPKTSTGSSTPAAAALDGKAMFYLLLLALQFGLQPVLTKKFSPPGITRSTVILMQELVKFFMALFMLRISNSFAEAVKGTNILAVLVGFLFLWSSLKNYR